MALMSSPRKPESASARRMLALMPSHQSDGFCSLQSGLGWLIGCGTLALAITAPASSMISALAPVVLISSPIK